MLFRVPAPVTLAAGHSLIIPIVNREAPIRRLALYDPWGSAGHPLAAVRLENDGESGLPPGVLTLYERDVAAGHAYVGDARLGPLPRGEHRLVSFAVDEKVQVSREARSRDLLTRATISRGVLQLTRLEQQVTVYRLKAPAQEARALLIEHPRYPDWQLATPAEKDVELTRDRYRIPVTLEAGRGADRGGRRPASADGDREPDGIADAHPPHVLAHGQPRREGSPGPRAARGDAR